MPPSAFDLLLLTGIGICGGSGQLLLAMAYRHAQASVLAPFEYVSLVWGTVFGFVVFADLPDAWTIAGAVAVAGGGVYLARRESTPNPAAEDVAKRPIMTDNVATAPPVTRDRYRTPIPST